MIRLHAKEIHVTQANQCALQQREQCEDRVPSDDPASGFLLKDSMVAQDGVFTATGLNGNNYPVSVDVAFHALIDAIKDSSPAK